MSPRNLEFFTITHPLTHEHAKYSLRDIDELFYTMSFILKWAKGAIKRPPSPPMRLPINSFEIVSESDVLEEEANEEYKAGLYYPMTIGEVLASKYQVIGKLGFEVTSTVWLARDLSYVSFQHTYNEYTELYRITSVD